MTIINAKTSKGKNLLATSMRYEGYYLHEIYGNYSTAKAKAWDWCYQQYLKDCDELGEDVCNFHICSHNVNTFSVSWDRPDGTRIETAYNSYLVC